MKVFVTAKYLKWHIDNKDYDLIIDSVKYNCERGHTPWWIACNGLTEEEMIRKGYMTDKHWFMEE